MSHNDNSPTKVEAFVGRYETGEVATGAGGDIHGPLCVIDNVRPGKFSCLYKYVVSKITIFEINFYYSTR